MTKPQSRTVLITGGATRIGKHIALGLAEDGWNVAIHFNKSQADAFEVEKKINDLGVKCMTIQADLARDDAVKGLISKVRQEIGSVHCLINNASMFSFDSPKEFNRSNLEEHMAVNLYAPMFLTSEFAKQVPENGSGCVINLLDQKIHNLNADFFTYTLSKIALEAATKLFASSLGSNIRVCGVSPGITLPSGEQTTSEFQKAHKRAPLGKSSLPIDIVGAVKYLINAHAITGTTIIVDGGQHLWPTKRDVQFEIDQ